MPIVVTTKKEPPNLAVRGLKTANHKREGKGDWQLREKEMSVEPFVTKCLLSSCYIRYGNLKSLFVRLRT